MGNSTVIIPAFKQAALTAQCLRALLEQHTDNIIVVDDGSTDSTPEILAGFGDRIRVLTHKTNRGFAASCNDGAALARTRFVVFLNNDTIPRPGWLQALEVCGQHNPKSSVIGSKLVYPDNTIQHAGVVICQDRYPRHIYAGFPADHPAANRSRRFQIVTGACMLVRRTVFERAKGFDTTFRNGFEDVDLCLRLGAQGHEIHYCAESVVEHFESVSPGRFNHDRHNVSLYRRRWLGRVQPDDLQYYIADGLLQLTYEGRYPISVEISPLLAALEGPARSKQVERRLRHLSAHANELSRENARLKLELGACNVDSPELRYHNLRRRVRETVNRLAPDGATVLVVSKGDPELVNLPRRRAWHFPQTENGSYAGHHPASSAEAIDALESLRKKGAHYLLIPATSLWWLDFYAEFKAHLQAHCTRLPAPEAVCALYRLNRANGQLLLRDRKAPSVSATPTWPQRTGSRKPGRSAV